MADPFKPKNFQEMMQDVIDTLKGPLFTDFVLSDLDNIENIVRLHDEADRHLMERMKHFFDRHEPICECGKEKHGFTSHSTWCKKWKTT